MMVNDHGLPTTGFLRLKQIIGEKNKDGGQPPLIPVSRTTWFNGVKSGRFPAPVRGCGGRISLYRVEDIRALLRRLSGESTENN